MFLLDCPNNVVRALNGMRKLMGEGQLIIFTVFNNACVMKFNTPKKKKKKNLR